MDKKKKFFYIFGGIGILFLILGIIFVINKGTEMPYFVITIILLILSGLLFTIAGAFRPTKEDKRR